MNKKDLLSRGYFPRELPPPFSTALFADWATSGTSPMPIRTRNTAKLCNHSYARYGLLRRRMGIPNPALFLDLCNAIEHGWSDLQAVISKSSLSQSKPTLSSSGDRAVAPSLDYVLLPIMRAECRSAGRYVLHADVSHFYHSIYTHSIPWALHSKSVAKARRSDPTLLGNTLDFLVRNSQDGQTLGIPIGPDTSFVLAEVVLCALDEVLSKYLSTSCSDYRGFRHSDDYELVFSKISDADAALSCLQRTLSDFELTVNPLKTRISELPLSLDSSWVLDLSGYTFVSGGRAEMQSIVRYFDRAFALQDAWSHEPVMKYALGRLNGFSCTSDNWPLLQHLLLQSVTVDPSTMQEALAIIHDHMRLGYTAAHPLVSAMINAQIQRHAPLGHSSEVAWAIWAAIVLPTIIEEPAAQAISQMEDSVVAVLALDAQRRGQLPTGLDTTKWEAFLTQDDLYGEQWLLSYEANVHGFLAASGGLDHVGADPWFSSLKSSRVTFYDLAATLKIPHAGRAGISG